MSDLIDRISAAICAKRCAPSEPCPGGCPLPHSCRSLAEAILPVVEVAADTGAVKARAWMRRWFFDGDEGMRGNRPRGWKLKEVTTIKALSDDVPLYALPDGARVVTAEQISALMDACEALESWDRCWPGNINIEWNVSKATAAMRRIAEGK